MAHFKTTTYAELISRFDSHNNGELTYVTDRGTFYFRVGDTLAEFPIPVYSDANLDLLNTALGQIVANTVIVDAGEDIQDAIDQAILLYGHGSATNRINILLKPGRYTAPFTRDGVNYGWALRLGGSDNAGDYVSIRPMHGFHGNDVVITATGTSVTGGTPSPCMIDVTGHCEISDVKLVCSILQESGSPVARFIHSDLTGADNLVEFKDLIFESTTGCAGVSSGIGAGQTLIVKGCHMRGGGDIVDVHGKTSTGGTSPALCFFQDLSSDGSVYNGAGSTKAYTGINIDGQVTLPDHDLIAIVTNCHFPRPSNQSAGSRGLLINHPPAGANDTINVVSATSNVVTTRTAHGFIVGQTITISGYSGGTGDANGTFVIATTPTEYTFTATGLTANGGTGGTATTSAPDIKWTYILDGSVPPYFSGIVGNHAWNCIQWPQPQAWPQTAGPTFSEGYGGIFDPATNTLANTSGANAAYPFVAAQTIDTAVGNRKVLINNGPYGHALVITGQAVALGDILVISGTNGQVTVDNTETDITKILGLAMTTKVNTGTGRVMYKSGLVVGFFR